MPSQPTDYKTEFNRKIAIGILGTELFWFDETKKALVYAVPLTDEGGGEYGGDIETIEVPEADLMRTPKITSRQTLDDITYTTHYTAARYKRWGEILSMTEPHTFVEVYNDLSAHIVRGTGQYTARTGDPRTIEATVAPENMGWIENVMEVTLTEFNSIKDMLTNESGVSMNFTGTDEAPAPLVFDLATIPENRVSPVQEESAEQASL